VVLFRLACERLHELRLVRPGLTVIEPSLVGAARPPSRAELEKIFFLDDADKALVVGRRGDHVKLGFGLQLVTVPSLGLFLADPIDVPSLVLDFVAERLEIADPSCVKRYLERRNTRFEHAEEIKRVFGLSDFSAHEAELVRWVGAWRRPSPLCEGGNRRRGDRPTQVIQQSCHDRQRGGRNAS
jgi:Domain of unknown function (DUF4158)